MNRGELTIVGTGIQFAAHLTAEARAHIAEAEKVLYLVTDPATASWIEDTNSTAQSLHTFYGVGKNRGETYEEMAQEILSWVRKQMIVCGAFYGHPGIFAQPTHRAIELARAEGFTARMLPAVSAEDCLFADLGIDPGTYGCQSYEATYFLARGRAPDTGAGLILWQLGAVGIADYQPTYDRETFEALVKLLRAAYGGRHKCVVYEAAVYQVYEPRVIRTTISGLLKTEIPPIATLYVPPKETR